MAGSLVSCDTFVALPPATNRGFIVFGKNSDRPQGEVQEVLHIPAATHEAGAKVQVGYSVCYARAFHKLCFGYKTCFSLVFDGVECLECISLILKYKNW